ncbi:H-2 class I histocompatibility antigen, Q9 alpha chain [Lates calcarifer]|uniref:H-2 class I histocompatibility antigen, Q9 alpha chain n=1 Tax=Lates calcarifer TaxID=8187 RepID=A0A4W6F3B2_LATCA|nr:H-2 class I histocompatibility antigen, Q9 alpha chain [Lates calcarifer]
MNTLIFLVLLGINSAAAVIHSLKYFYTASSQVPNFPEFVAVGMFDEDQIAYYDSKIRTTEPRQDWMNKVVDPQYWERSTGIFSATQPNFKANIEILKQRFNQTGGVHIFQFMYGCEWDDENKEVKGNWQYGYDGDDFIAFDLKTETWIAPTPQAVITKLKWDKDRAWITQAEQYLNQICPEWVKKYVDYGRSSLLRTDLPSVSLLQKTPSSPVSCHATGFYPDRAMMFWRKDGEDLHDGVEKGEILPNHDGTFQMSVELKSVSPEDWGKYECVFQLSGVKEDIIKRLDKAVIISNEKPTDTTPIIIAAVVVLALVIAIAAIGFFIYKKKNDKRPPYPASNQEVIEQTMPLSA